MNGRPFFDVDWTLEHLDDVLEGVLRHAQLVAIPVAIGFVIALVLGIVASRRPVIIGPELT